ncbi:MAG: type II toxin-antitoxin system VapC family toxin [Candidatus Omnitrophica bacterium]|nr:type II toxin-antitoxin system VapC family toxin [Candidatus Omnitrophota bacterium]
MANYLLDSDVLIWLLRGRQETMQRLERLEGPFGVSVISRAEIWAGARPSEQHQIEQLFLSLSTYAVDGAIADLAGKFLRQYRGRGPSLELPDALIAATAVVHELSLVTYNVPHFPMPELKLASPDI